VKNFVRGQKGKLNSKIVNSLCVGIIINAVFIGDAYLKSFSLKTYDIMYTHFLTTLQE